MWNATILEGQEYPIWRRKSFEKTNPISWESFLHIPSPKWTDLRFSYARGLWYLLPFRGPIRMTNYNFHGHVQYCITIRYYSCSIDIYRNVKDVKCHNFGKLGISHFEKAGHLSSGQLDLTLYHSSLHSCSIWQIQKCGRLQNATLWKVRNILFWESRILQNSPQKLGQFSLISLYHLTSVHDPLYSGSVKSSTFKGTYQIDNL